MRPNLTPKEEKLFHHVRAELIEGRPAPTYRQLLELMNLRSKSNINRLVVSLVAKGYLAPTDGFYRNIRLAAGAETHTVHLPPAVDARLSAHVAAWGSTPQHVIAQAVTEYLARRP